MTVEQLQSVECYYINRIGEAATLIDVNNHLHMLALVVALARRLDEDTVDGLVSYL